MPSQHDIAIRALTRSILEQLSDSGGEMALAALTRAIVKPIGGSGVDVALAALACAVAEVITGFDGFVARYMGDGVLTYFGYPQAHEDDAERAVRAGLGAVDAVGRLDIKSVKFQARVGIATGLVVVGDLIGDG